MIIIIVKFCYKCFPIVFISKVWIAYAIFEDTKNDVTATKADFKDEYFTKIIVFIKLAYTTALK